jgi:hypothetical protein
VLPTQSLRQPTQRNHATNQSQNTSAHIGDPSMSMSVKPKLKATIMADNTNNFLPSATIGIQLNAG